MSARKLQQHTAEALFLYQQGLTIREQALGLDHPKTCTLRAAYIHLLREIGRIEDAVAIEGQESVKRVSEK